MPSLCSIIIPVFNKWELTAACLRSLREHTRGDDFEVIVIDNGSTDATEENLTPLGTGLFHDRFQRIRYGENRNFAPACNAGAQTATAPLLFFLNNDTLLTPGWMPPLLEAFHTGSPAAVGPLLLYDDMTVQHLGVTFTPTGVTHLYSRFPADHPAVKKTRRLQALTAAALMVPRSAFLEVGGFYEGYRNGFEDLELSLRLRQRGGKLVCIPDSRIIHLESQTPGRSAHDAANARLLRERCGRDFFVDIHHHGMRDGFVPVMDDFYGISLCLSPENEAKLLSQAGQLSFGALAQLTREHPFWISGRELLARRLEQHEKFQESCLVRFAVSEILPSLAAFQSLAVTAARARDTILLAAAEQCIHDIGELREDTGKALDILRTVVRNAYRHKDIMLAQMYAAKIAEIS